MSAYPTACEFCLHGIVADDNGVKYVECTLDPPTPVGIGPELLWVRPKMKPSGYCGQFRPPPRDGKR